MRIALAPALFLLALAAPVVPVAAQSVTWHNRVTFYGDNTEFFTPYRVGETILGAQFRSEARIRPSRRTEILAGAFGDVRWGSTDFLDEVKPVLGFRYRGDHTTAVLGTLITERRHGLLDPLAVSTLELTRPIEYGLQWIERRRTWDLDVFIDWQALNTETQREVFDYGLVLRVRPVRRLSLEAQVHGLHHGGQLHTAGVPVTNNIASGLGATVGDTLGWLGASALTLYRLWSKGNIDPDAPAERPDRGRGWFIRGSVTPRGLVEVFGIYWRGRDFLSDEGDNNYNSVGADPTFYRSRRTYFELGLSRRTRIDDVVNLDAEFRLHRIDDESSVALFGSKWEYSYRLVVSAPFDFTLRR